MVSTVEALVLNSPYVVVMVRAEHAVPGSDRHGRLAAVERELGRRVAAVEYPLHVLDLEAPGALELLGDLSGTNLPLMWDSCVWDPRMPDDLLLPEGIACA